MKAYLFWYKSSEYATTEYIYIIALSVSQARFYFYQAGYGHMLDYSYSPIDEIDENRFMKKHLLGEILGQYAVI